MIGTPATAPGRAVGATTLPAPWRHVLGAAGLVLLALAGVALLLQAQYALTGNLWGMPLDDAYIHFRFARNLAAGHGFAFNPDQPVPASTSPLWVLLLAPASLLGVPLWLAAKVYGVVFLAAAAVLTWRLTARFVGAPAAAWAAGALTALDGRLLWAAPSGMEVTLFATLSLSAFVARPAPGATGLVARRRILLVAFLCGLAALARPEGLLLAVVLAVDLYRRHRPPAATMVVAGAIVLALVAPYALFALATTGHPLPTTFYAKAASVSPALPARALSYLIVLALLLLRGNIALILAPLGIPVLWRMGGPARAVVAWPLLLVVEQAILSPVLYHFGRYVMPLDPFFALWAVVGIGRLTRPAGRADAWRSALPALALVVIGALAINGWAGLYAYSVQNIDAMHVTLGRWVRAHVAPGAPVAMNDVGAIGYISDHPVVDIEGLVTPRFSALKVEQPLSRRGRDMYAEIKRRGAHYLIVFPRVYPWLVTEPGLRRVYGVTLRRPVIVPAATMVVYRLGG